MATFNSDKFKGYLYEVVILLFNIII